MPSSASLCFDTVWWFCIKDFWEIFSFDEVTSSASGPREAIARPASLDLVVSCQVIAFFPWQALLYFECRDGFRSVVRSFLDKHPMKILCFGSPKSKNVYPAKTKLDFFPILWWVLQARTIWHVVPSSVCRCAYTVAARMCILFREIHGIDLVIIWLVTHCRTLLVGRACPWDWIAFFPLRSVTVLRMQGWIQKGSPVLCR